MKKIIVAFANIENANRVCDILISGNYRVEGVCQTGAQVLHLLSTTEADDVLLITGYKLSDMVAIQLLEMMPPGIDSLMLLTSNQQVLCSEYNAFSLTLPVRKSDLLNTVRMIFETGQKAAGFKREPSEKRERTEEDKAIILEAKAVLMERHKMTEEQAHRFIQKRSMDSGMSMVETSKIIISD